MVKDRKGAGRREKGMLGGGERKEEEKVKRGEGMKVIS